MWAILQWALLAMAWVFSWPFRPLVWAGKLAWISFLYTYDNVLQMFGILVLCGFVFLAFHRFQQQVQDPYDIEGSVRQLRKSANLARLTLKEAELRHIGEYPLGGEIEDAKEQPASENGGKRPQSTPPSALLDVSLAPGPAAEQMNGHAAAQAPSSPDIEELFKQSFGRPWKSQEV
jgi:hypothetical protein